MDTLTVLNSTMQQACQSLSTILNKMVTLVTTTTSAIITVNSVSAKVELPPEAFVVEMEYTKGVSGLAVWVIEKPQSLVIADIMMGGDGKTPASDFNELHFNAAKEALSQMSNAFNAKLTEDLRTTIEAGTFEAKIVDFGKEEAKDEKGILLVSGMPKILNQPEFCLMKFSLKIEGINGGFAAAKMVLLTSKSFIEALEQLLTGPYPVIGMPHLGGGIGPGAGLERFSNVPVKLTVELGQLRTIFGKLSELKSGDIIELEKLAGEPLDVFVQGTFIAKGTPVVIDDKIGIKITWVKTT